MRRVNSAPPQRVEQGGPEVWGRVDVVDLSFVHNRDRPPAHVNVAIFSMPPDLRYLVRGAADEISKLVNNSGARVLLGCFGNLNTDLGDILGEVNAQGGEAIGPRFYLSERRQSRSGGRTEIPTAFPLYFFVRGPCGLHKITVDCTDKMEECLGESHLQSRTQCPNREDMRRNAGATHVAGLRQETFDNRRLSNSVSVSDIDEVWEVFVHMIRDGAAYGFPDTSDPWGQLGKCLVRKDRWPQWNLTTETPEQPVVTGSKKT